MAGLSRLKDGGWYWTVLGAGFLERVSSCWMHVAHAAGCDWLSGGVGPESPVYVGPTYSPKLVTSQQVGQSVLLFPMSVLT